VYLAPSGNFVPWGWNYPRGVKFSVSPSILLISRECSPRGWTKEWTFPLGDKFHPWGTNLTPGGQVHPWGSGVKLRMALCFFNISRGELWALGFEAQGWTHLRANRGEVGKLAPWREVGADGVHAWAQSWLIREFKKKSPQKWFDNVENEWGGILLRVGNGDPRNNI
jgi:hypothetical protein